MAIRRVKLPNNSVVSVNDDRIHIYDNVSGVAAKQASPYCCAKYDVTDVNVLAYADRMVVCLDIPVVGDDNYGVGFQINSLGYKPVIMNDGATIGASYNAGEILWLVYDSSQQADLYIDSTSAVSITGCWRVVNSETRVVQGVQGVQGLKGDQGVQGRQGVQGIQGLNGDQGVQGVQGVQGLKGDQGVQGIQGVQGVQGLKGDQGVQGVQGLKGDQGVQGRQGVQGVQGLKGDQGVQGVQGLKGDQGVQGRQGVQGVQGLNGDQGVQGVQGLKGDQGVQGIDGRLATLQGLSDTNINSLQDAQSLSYNEYYDTWENRYALAGAIPFGIVDATSTSTSYTATVKGIDRLEDGVCVMLKNGVVSSSTGFKININGLGAKPVYTNLAAATAETSKFSISYTMLFVYDSTRITGGCWVCYNGYDSNTIAYQVRTNSFSKPMSSVVYRHRLLFSSPDDTKFVPANNSTSTNATASRTVNQEPINPFGRIVYYGTTAPVAAGNKPNASYLWDRYTLTLGYSFNGTGAALVLPFPKPIYIKCTPQADGSAIIDATTPYVTALPTTNDGSIYIYLGEVYSETNIELIDFHPVFYHNGNGIRIWTGESVLDGNPIEVTYSELVDLRDNGLLIPNAKYQITDYVTMINEHSVNMLALSGLDGSTDLPIDYYKLAESTYGTQAYKQFDIIATALDSSHLDENCRMTKHGNETYFDDFGLHRWKIKYCLDNDTSRFEFACSHNEITAVIGTGDTVSVTGTAYNTTPHLQQVAQNEHHYSGVITDGSTFGAITYMLIGDDTTTMYDENHNVIGQLTSSTLVSGRGVVYYMEDMNDNKLSYDYINIKFHRFGVDLSQSEYFSGSCIDYGTGSDGICAFDMLNLSQIMDGEQTITEDYYYTFHDRATGENTFDKFASITILDTTQICVELYGLYLDIFSNATLPHNVFLADISNDSMFSNAAKYLYGYTLKHTQGSTFIITDIGYDDGGLTSRLLENVYGCVFGSVSGNYLKVPNMERCAFIVAIELDVKHMSYVSQCQFKFVETDAIDYVNKCDFYDCSGFTIGDAISNCTFRNVYSSVFGSGLDSCFFTGTFLSIGNKCNFIGFFGNRYINGYDIESSYDKVSANCIKIGDFCNYIYFNNRNVGSNAQTIGYQNIVIGNCCSYMDFYSDDYNLYKNIIVADNFNGGKNSSTEECFHLSEFVEMWYPRSSADFYYNKNYNIKVGRNSFDEIVCWIDGDFVQPKYFVPDLTYVKNGNSVVVSAANSNYDIVYSNSFTPTPNNFNSSGNGSLTVYIPQADYMYFVAYDINTLICGKPLVLKISDL